MLDVYNEENWVWGIHKLCAIFAINLELYDTVMVDTCHHTFSKTYRMYNTECALM